MVAGPVATITESGERWEKHFITNHLVKEQSLRSVSAFGCYLAVLMCICDK